MFQFFCRFAFFKSTFSSFKPDTENNANFDAVSSKCANFDEVQFFLKHLPKLTIFGTYNLHTFKHNTLINELLLMQFYQILYRRNTRQLAVFLAAANSGAIS